MIELSKAEKKLISEIDTLLIRVGKNYDTASHPALLITAHRDEIIRVFQQAGYKSPEEVAELKTEGCPNLAHKEIKDDRTK